MLIKDGGLRLAALLAEAQYIALPGLLALSNMKEQVG